MTDLPNSSRRGHLPGWPLTFAFVVLVALVSGLWFTRAAARVSAAPTRRQLFLAVDGVSFEGFQYAQAHGLFKRFKNVGRMIAPYPSMSHGSWTQIIGTERAFGLRGRLPTVEARWFDLDAQRIADDPRQVFARQAAPYNYMRAFDTYFDPLVEPLMYFPGHRVFDRELDETERAILDGFTGSHYAAYFSGTDAMAHTHKDELHPFLIKVDAMTERVLGTLEARGGPVDVWMVSDHGNAGSFMEGQPETYMTPVSLKPAIKRAGLVLRDTGAVMRDNEVANVTIALSSMVDMYFHDLSQRRRFADEVLKERGVSLVTWMEVQNGQRSIIIRAPDGGEASVKWHSPPAADRGEYLYAPQSGNPLALPDSLLSTAAAPHWISDSVSRHASIDGPWPDALNRLVASAEKQIENAPDLIVNLADGYSHDGDFARVVRMVRTHGSLASRGSFGIVASTSGPVPHDVRAEEVASIMGVTPRQMLRAADWLHPSNADSLAASLGQGARSVATSHSDHSIDAEFGRRLKPLVQSMGYLDWTQLRTLQSLFPSSDATTTDSFDWKATAKKIQKTDLLLGLSRGVDTLLALGDSLDVNKIDERLQLAADRLRGIPELRPLAEIHDDWRARRARGNATLAAGGGANFRSAAMLAWTVPFFIDAALDIPEVDSIPDPRNPQFARSWYRSDRVKVRQNPGRLFGNARVASTLFQQVFAERTLWQRVEPAAIPLMYDPDLSDVTVVLVPGIYGELFDGELWRRGLQSVHHKLGLRTLTVRADGRCSAPYNAGVLRNALRDDTRRRLERGYTKPRYLLIGYSKGGVDATEMLRQDPGLARDQIEALVTVATPHLGTPVAERAELPAGLLEWASRDSMPTVCKADGSAASLYPSTRRAFWVANADSVGQLTRLFSVAFATDVHQAHPWMKITKQIGQFGEPNDGVVAVNAARFPANVPAVDLGTVAGDHIAGIAASSFPQEAFLEAIVVTLGELGALDRLTNDAWRIDQRRWLSSPASRASRGSLVPPFPQSLRSRSPLPGGSAGWTPTATFRLLEASSVQDRGVKTMSPSLVPDGFIMHCDQRDIIEFRREYEYVYDAGNGGSEGDLNNGFSIVADKGARTGRACHLATEQAAIKMTSVSVRFRPVDYPDLAVHVRVAQNVKGVDVSNKQRGANDNAFKLWFVVRDTRPGATNSTRLFGYAWTSVNRDGVASPAGELREAASSRRSLVVTTLPEAWLITIGNAALGTVWQNIGRDLVADLKRAYPNVPTEAFEVVGVTVQSDSDESHSRSETYLDEIAFRRRTPK